MFWQKSVLNLEFKNIRLIYKQYIKQIFIYILIILNILILVIIIILISVAFLTLLERKLLGRLQLRKGPNKIGYWGIIQPFSDAIKLIRKEVIILINLNLLYYLLRPIFIFIIILIIWLIYPFLNILLRIDLGLVYLLCCLRIRSYGLLISGWASNSTYSILGAVRSLAQSISYEVRLSIIIISIFLILESFNLIYFIFLQKDIWFICILLPLRLIFFLRLMAELNRAPFDFSEGESELVSGFNVEFIRSGFVIIFLSEYARVLFLRFLFRLIFLGGGFIKFKFYLNILLIRILIIWLRGSIPRFRYDLLIYICWLIILPISLRWILNVFLLKNFFYN